MSKLMSNKAKLVKNQVVVIMLALVMTITLSLETNEGVDARNQSILAAMVLLI